MRELGEPSVLQFFVAHCQVFQREFLDVLLTHNSDSVVAVSDCLLNSVPVSLQSAFNLVLSL